jgi:ABC-type nitrate/sulfonate/bicarbonate transport system substrate-binding protein
MATRRDILKLSAAAAAGAALGLPAARRAAAAEGEPLSFMTPFGYIPDFLEMMNMVSGGYLAKQGFAPKLIGGKGTATAIQQLIAGRVAFIRMTGIDEFNAVAKQKAPLVSVSTLYQGSNFYFISARDKPVKNAADMKGKTIGVVSVGGSTEALLDLTLRSAGLSKKDVKIEVVGNSPGAFQYVRQGRVDCFINSLAVVVALRRSNAAMEAWPTDRAAPMPAQIYVTSQDLIDKKPEVVVRFLKALKGSTGEMLHGDIAAIFQRAAKDFDIPGIKKMDELVELMKFTMENPWMAAGKENFLRNVPKLWNDADREIRGAGIAAVPSVDALYTNKYIDAALKA